MAFETADARLAWCAGILEGEGCFSTFLRSSNKCQGVAIHCEMTDEDTILRLREFLGVGNIVYRLNDKRKDGRKRKPTWICSIQKQEEVFDVLLKLLPMMSERRSLKIKEQIEVLKTKEFYVKNKS